MILELFNVAHAEMLAQHHIREGHAFAAKERLVHAYQQERGSKRGATVIPLLARLQALAAHARDSLERARSRQTAVRTNYEMTHGRPISSADLRRTESAEE